MEKSRIIILGGGPCGLACAWELAERGADVVVLEKESWVGGLCHTHEFRGFRFDLGGHRFISSDQYIFNRICNLLSTQLLVRKRKSVVNINGRLFAYPVNVLDFINKMDLATLLQISKELCSRRNSPISQSENPYTLEDWCVSRFGQTLYKIFFEEYNKKLWGMPASQISGTWASQRIPSVSIANAIRGLLPFSRKARTISKCYYYPQLGIGEICDAMAKKTEALGGRVFRNFRLHGIQLEDGRIRALRGCIQNNEEQSLDCDYVVSTIPVQDLIKSLPENFPQRPSLVSHASRLRYRALRFFNIILDRPKVSDNTWQYVPQKNVLFTRIQEPRMRSPHMVQGSKTSVMLEIPCALGDQTWLMENDQLLERIIDDLNKMGIKISSREILGYFSTYAEHAYPIYTLDYMQNRSTVLEFLLNNCSNLLLCGRQGAFRYLFMDFAMKAGIEAARWIAGEDTCDRLQIADVMNSSELIESLSLTDTVSKREVVASL